MIKFYDINLKIEGDYDRELHKVRENIFLFCKRNSIIRSTRKHVKNAHRNRMLRKFSKDLKRGFQIAKIVQRKKVFCLVSTKKSLNFVSP